MVWVDSDTLRLKSRIEAFSSVTDYQTAPGSLAKAFTDNNKGGLLGESGCENYLRRLVQEAGNKNPKKFVAFQIKRAEPHYENALKEAGMLFTQNKTHFTPAGIAFLWDACGIHRDT